MCFGAFKRVCHWGPLIALAIIKAVTMATVACLTQWWPPWKTLGGSVLFLSFMGSAVSTLYFFMHAMFTGPGIVPKEWSPKRERDRDYLQFCSSCQGYKAPRAHHCRKCGTCNMKMDHHCPWINNCVGHKNHASFALFLFFAVVGCAQGSFILAASIYRAIHRTWYIYYGTGNEPIVYMTLWGLVANMFVLGLAIGVVIAVGMLLYFQIRGILRNRTAVEDWILEKAVYRRGLNEEPFVYPYYFGRWKNFTQVINLWCEPKGDGITWPVRQGCNQYTLTIEQLSQKEEKRARSREYIITEAYSGFWFPCTKGFGVCCHPPCTDEPRIKLVIGDSIIVTRWKKYWLYGERIEDDTDSTSGIETKNRHRGWFPRRCAVEVLHSSEMDSDFPANVKASCSTSPSSPSCSTSSISHKNSKRRKNESHKKPADCDKSKINNENWKNR